MGNQRYRNICYAQLVKNGYLDPQLFYERRTGNVYSSYWGSDNRRMEVYYNRHTDKLLVYELKFIA